MGPGSDLSAFVQVERFPLHILCQTVFVAQCYLQ